ncbi:MAG: PQQ-like beta-propeller repeat protein [Fuerstiella sp.]|nr:PQQ-like beta-propeller repeat protein [Fuerstiella sp.]
MLRPVTLPLFIVCFVCGSLPLSAADMFWTGMLGPNRDGWVSYFQPPEQWPKELRTQWRVEVGTGYGSPLVVGDRVFQHGRQGQDEVVRCLDLHSGSVIWQKSHVVPFEIGGGAEKHGKGPKSSPVFVNGRLFTMSITGQLSARDGTTGNLLWRRDYDARFGKSCPYWGAATSPIADREHIFVHFGTDEQGALVALSQETGEESWTQGSDGASYSSPLVVDLDGVRQIVEWNHQSLVGVDCRTGHLLWEYEFPHEGSNQNMPTPVVYGGHILLGAENRGLHSLEPQQKNGQWTVENRWSQNKIALDMSTAVINGDLLYGFSHYGKGRLFCVNAGTGEILWQGPGRSGENATFLSLPGHVAALTDNGKLQIITADGGKSAIAASWSVADDRTWAPPVMLPNGILVKDHDTLTRWSFD